MKPFSKLTSLIRNQSGLGLEDLLVIISIVCAAGAFVLPEFLKPEQDKGLLAKANADLEIIVGAIRKLEGDTGVLAGYPGPNKCINDPEFEFLDVCRIGLVCNDGKYPNWKGPYLANVPKDPWGHSYYIDNDYRMKGRISRVVGSMGPNGVQDYEEPSDDVLFVLCVEPGPGA